jgi:hypothetical protein
VEEGINYLKKDYKKLKIGKFYALNDQNEQKRYPSSPRTISKRFCWSFADGENHTFKVY